MTNLEAAEASLIFSCDTGSLGHDSVRLSRAAQRGVLTRVKQGVYLESAHWSVLTPAERHRLRLVIAERLSGPGLVFSHQSAAALLGLPILGRWPDKAQVLSDCATGGRSTAGLARHALGLSGAPLITVYGLVVTAPARTVVDLATTLGFDAAVVAADAAVHTDRRTGVALTTIGDVRAMLLGMSPFRGMTRVASVLECATELAESPAETLCRLILGELGFAAPELQARFDDAEGLIGYADFAWRREKVALEFDGLAKYLDDEFTHGRSAAQIVVIEKKREDRLRALGYRVIRIYWEDLRDPARLLRLLRAAGLRPVRLCRLVLRPGL